MLYESTRGGMRSLGAAEVITRGMAPDGGLFVPSGHIKVTDGDIKSFAAMSYRERAVFILGKFLGDYSEAELKECVNASYSDANFDNAEIAPVIKMNDMVYVLELWHGPTCAFKDMALQILPRLLVKAVEKTGGKEETVILVATSGDTGKAALEGFKDVAGTRVIVFYPDSGVSEIQKMQMVTQEGRNTYAIGVKGNFDDAQNGVKELFADAGLTRAMGMRGCKFSSANSINWGRLVPQIVYYFSAYADLLARGELIPGEKVNIAVPTGNFGNILAAWYAGAAGLPVNRLICASNDNNVLTDFINTGTYDRNRDFRKTISPSMDILISSNLERLLYEQTGRDPAPVAAWMDKLRTDGRYTVDEDIHKKIKAQFWAGHAGEPDTLKTIEFIFKEYGYMVDTHTAVGIDVYDKYVISTGDLTKTIVASTASPFKFNESVAKAILGEEAVKGKSEFELLTVLSERCSIPIPKGLSGLDKKPVLHKSVVEKEGMKGKVMEILGLHYEH